MKICRVAWVGCTILRAIYHMILPRTMVYTKVSFLIHLFSDLSQEEFEKGLGISCLFPVKLMLRDTCDIRRITY